MKTKIIKYLFNLRFLNSGIQEFRNSGINCPVPKCFQSLNSSIPQSSIVNFLSPGFTIVELMIALAISMFALGAVYSSFIVQQRSLMSQDQVSETQVSSKIGFDLLVNDIRTAGFGYPVDENPTIGGVSTSITPSEAGLNSGSDSITLVGGFSQVALLSAPAVMGQDQITFTYLLGASPLNTGASRYISLDGVDYAEITNCSLDGNSNCQEGISNPLTLDRAAGINFPANTPIYLLQSVSYQVTNNRLEKTIANGTPVVVADNVEDLQLVYGVDTDSDDLINDQNANGIFDYGDYVTTPLPANSRIMKVRVSILARTANEDPNLQPSTKPYYTSGVQLENNNTNDTDLLRRRIWSMDVAVRNPR